MASSTHNSNAGTTIGIIIVVVLAVLAGVYFMNDGARSDRLSRASEEFSEEGSLSDGLREGSEELQDRSTVERVGDSIGDAGRDLQQSAREAAE